MALPEWDTLIAGARLRSLALSGDTICGGSGQ